MRGGLKWLSACLPAGGAMEEDFLLAQWLQAEWVAEAEKQDEAPVPAPPRPLSVVDETWELLDPTPDVRGLFTHFNETLFWGRLDAVEVKWSPRMTSCAGVCSYEGRGGMCSIRLSEPLLKLRPRKDLVETLLHEMIHALLFVTDNDKDRDSHGPRFCKHMHRINSLTGANITIYHEFHDEVDSYRQHWWRCNGPCRSRKPYFGYVKRAMNRAPSANDFWWYKHQQTCGGTFIKVKEPEKYLKRGKENNKQEFLPDDKERTPGSKIQSTIPFSGKGYVLGGKSNIFSSERTTSPSNSKGRELQVSQYHSSADSVTLNRKNEMDLGQSVSYTNTFPLFSCSDKKSSASSIILPKYSVANKNVYTNVNGSPTRNVNFDGRKSNLNSTNAKWGLLQTGTPKRNSPEPTVSSPRSWTSSQGNDDLHTSGGPPKRAKMEDTAAFKAYFTKGMEPGWISPSVKRGAEVEQIHLEKSPPPESNQNRQVSCPVCQSEVLEAKINEHLDSCLSEALK